MGGVPLRTGRSVRDWRGWASRSSLSRYVFADKFVTGGDATAGIDMTFRLTARQFGDELAKIMQLTMEYDPRPPFPGWVQGELRPLRHPGRPTLVGGGQTEQAHPDRACGAFARKRVTANRGGHQCAVGPSNALVTHSCCGPRKERGGRPPAR